MEHPFLYETILDNLQDGVYMLDDQGNYIYVNRAYVQMLNMPKSVLLQYNVHDFLSTSQIELCISDIVYEEKRQVVMFQDVLDTEHYGRKKIRQMVISTPIFDQTGQISNIVAVVRPLDALDALYDRASKGSIIPTFTGVQKTPNVTGHDIIAESVAMKELFSIAQNVAQVDSSVLLTGESGTGKEVIARFLHDESPRSKNKLVIIDCASLPENLLEAELFGYEKGAFTGALSSGKQGLFEEADGGTLFLDEVNSLPLSLQGKVLRAIETKSIQRIGSVKSKTVDFRLITATNENLVQLISEKLFRPDLYYRINVIPIRIPPLRERTDDIVPLALHFLESFCQKYDKQKAFTAKTLHLITQYPWPGNVRELRNFVERSVVMTIDSEIEVLDIRTLADDPTMDDSSEQAAYDAADSASMRNIKYEEMLEAGVSLDDFVSQCEREYVDYALNRFQNSYRAADALGTSQTSIMRKKKKYSL